MQVDFSGTVGDDFLENLGLIKGTRKVVNHEERGKVLHALDGCSYKLSAGGSLSNTLVALARLGIATSQSFALNVAMTGSVGSDALGDFYRCGILLCHVLGLCCCGLLSLSLISYIKTHLSRMSVQLYLL